MSLTRCLILAAATLAGAPALAQPKGPPPAMPPGPGGDRGPEELRRDVVERMRAMRAWKLTEALKLDEATSAKLFPVLARFDDKEMDLGKERNEIMRGLNAEVEAPKPDNARLTQYVDRMLALRVKQRAIEDDKVKELRKVLTPLQQARLMMILPRIEQHFRERMREAREERRRVRGGDMF